jgi:hypothetical protein
LVEEPRSPETHPRLVTRSLQPPSAAIPLLRRAISQLEGDEGWVGLGTLGQRLASINSDFDPRTYGYRKLSDLVRTTNMFELNQPEGGALRIRFKPQPPKGRKGMS